MSRTNASNSRQYLDAAKELEDNPGQLAVYRSTGDCVVLAGPGSGKTKTLTIKVARILHEDLQAPQALACLTYSTECVRELERRLERLGVHAGEGLFVGTVHSFCLKHIVFPFGPKSDFAVPRDIGVASVKEQETQFLCVLDVTRRYEHFHLMLGADMIRRPHFLYLEVLGDDPDSIVLQSECE